MPSASSLPPSLLSRQNLQHRDLLLQALQGIGKEAEEETSFEEFQRASGIASIEVAKSAVEFLARRGICSLVGTAASSTQPSRNSSAASKDFAIVFSGTGRLDAAILALQHGCDVEKVSEHLSWKDFEKLAAKVLGSLGYSTRTNVRMARPRMEIDVVGVSSGFAVVADCKHWRRCSPSSIAVHAHRQAERTGRLVRRSQEHPSPGAGPIEQAVPVILTLHAESVRFASGIPVVPISQFRSFVMDVRGFLADMCVIRSDDYP